MLEDGSKKRIIIILIYILIPLLLGLGIYVALSEEETCFDNKKNQNEKDVDCGGVCSPCFSVSKDLSVGSKEFVFGGNGIYDGLVEVINPNINAGASSFSYKATLKDSQGSVIEEKNGRSFILPSETKHIGISGFTVPSSQVPASMDFEISNVEWKEFTDYQKPELTVSGVKFNPLENGLGGEVYGIVRNKSIFSFDTIKVTVVLRDYSGKLVALNSTQINTVRSGEERDFRLAWTYNLPGDVAETLIEAEADTYDSDNFLKTYIE